MDFRSSAHPGLGVAVAVAVAAIAGCGGDSRDARGVARAWVSAVNHRDWHAACRHSLGGEARDCPAILEDGLRHAVRMRVADVRRVHGRPYADIEPLTHPFELLPDGDTWIVHVDIEAVPGHRGSTYYEPVP